jgi:hypothetical protein
MHLPAVFHTEGRFSLSCWRQSAIGRPFGVRAVSRLLAEQALLEEHAGLVAKIAAIFDRTGDKCLVSLFSELDYHSTQLQPPAWVTPIVRWFHVRCRPLISQIGANCLLPGDFVFAEQLV